MRPYEVVPGEWVDLDTVQSISSPWLAGETEDTFTLEWRHAFQAEPRRLRFTQPKVCIENVGWFPKLTMDGVPTELDRVRREVFEPFFKAWSKT